MVTYNVDFVCTYMHSESNDAYRDDLLDLLGVEKFDDDVINGRIAEIAKDISGSADIKPLLERSAGRFLSEDLEVGLMALFSYDSLHLIHGCLCDFYSLGKVSEGRLTPLQDYLSKK